MLRIVVLVCLSVALRGVLSLSPGVHYYDYHDHDYDYGDYDYEVPPPPVCRIMGMTIPEGQGRRMPPPSCAYCRNTNGHCGCVGLPLMRLGPQHAKRCNIITCKCRRYVVDKRDPTKPCKGIKSRRLPRSCLPSCSIFGKKIPYGKSIRMPPPHCGTCRNYKGSCGCVGMPLMRLGPKQAKTCKIITCKCRRYIVDRRDPSKSCKGIKSRRLPRSCLPSCSILGMKIPYGKSVRMPPPQCGTCRNTNGHCGCVGNPLMRLSPQHEKICKIITCNCKRYVVNKRDPRKPCKGIKSRRLPRSCLPSCTVFGKKIPYGKSIRMPSPHCGTCRNTNGHCGCVGLPLMRLGPKHAKTCKIFTCNCRRYVVDKRDPMKPCKGIRSRRLPKYCLPSCVIGRVRIPYGQSRRMPAPNCGYCRNRNGHCGCVGMPLMALSPKDKGRCKMVKCNCRLYAVKRADPSKTCYGNKPSGLKKSCYGKEFH